MNHSIAIFIDEADHVDVLYKQMSVGNLTLGNIVGFLPGEEMPTDLSNPDAIPHLRVTGHECGFCIDLEALANRNKLIISKKDFMAFASGGTRKFHDILLCAKDKEYIKTCIRHHLAHTIKFVEEAGKKTKQQTATCQLQGLTTNLKSLKSVINNITKNMNFKTS
jgi:hypothetical protein